MLDAFIIAMLLCALCPALLFCVNLRQYRAPGLPDAAQLSRLKVSVLIPARNEEGAIRAAVESVLRSSGVDLDLLVMDDGSTDRTAEIVREIAVTDARVRLQQGGALPNGWNGKQHACWSLAKAASYDLLCFMDADVTLDPSALERMANFQAAGNSGLVSGFPRQLTGTFLEWLLLPLIHFVLLGFLPVSRMRSNTDPAFSAGCGQFMLVRRDAYFASGGHAAIKTTMHDGLLLPRLLRQHGYRTDLADLTSLASCRMYRSAGQLWQGLSKNATEGIAAPVRIGPISTVLILGQVTPFVLALWFAVRGGSLALWFCVGIAMAAAWLPRVLAAVRFRQDWRSALLHPIGIIVLLALQWYSLARKLMGREVRWKDRAYAGG